jgi:hypothetical protein
MNLTPTENSFGEATIRVTPSTKGDPYIIVVKYHKTGDENILDHSLNALFAFRGCYDHLRSSFHRFLTNHCYGVF